MMIFGKFLLERRVLTRPQLEEATQSQVVFGGRLGTSLVELGYLRIDELEGHLAEHLGVPTAPAEWIERPAEEALKSVPAALVKRHGILPLALEKQTLHLAMLDPRDPDQLDDIAFATGLRIQPYAMSELRLTALLEHHYGVPRDTRYISLGPEAARSRRASKRPERAAERTQQAPPADAPGERADLGMNSLGEDQDLIDEETFSLLHESFHAVPAEAQEDPVAPAASPAPAATEMQPEAAHDAADATADGAEDAPIRAALAVAALEAELAAASDRDTVGRLALRIACFHASAAALFVVRGGMVSGFLGDGEGTKEILDGVLIPAEADTIFAPPATAGTPFRGRPPEGGINERVLAALSRRGVREALVTPIAVRDRVINLLYADNGSERLGETSVAALGALCVCVSHAYERLILEQKGKLA